MLCFTLPTSFSFSSHEGQAPKLTYPTSTWRSSVYQLLLPPTVKLVQRWKPRLAPRVLLLTPNIVVKYGSLQLWSEVRAIDLVLRNTSLPVPRIITAFRSSRGSCYILMRRCAGDPLCNVFRTLSPKERVKVILQLRGFMDELRALNPPDPNKIGSAEYGPLDDERLSSSPCGPFANVSEFHKAIRGGFSKPTGHDECDEMISLQDRRKYGIRFTHGDLSFRHIYYSDGKITGIIDWESAGWFPDYWEYVTTWDSFWDNSDLRGEIGNFMEVFPEELKMEQTRRKLFRGQ